MLNEKDIYTEIIWNNIEILLKEKGLTPTDLKEKIENLQNDENLEKWERELFNTSELYLFCLAKVLDGTIEELLTDRNLN